MELLEKGAPESAEVGVLGIVNLSNAPRINTSADTLPVDFNLLLRTNYSKWHKCLE